MSLIPQNPWISPTYSNVTLLKILTTRDTNWIQTKCTQIFPKMCKCAVYECRPSDPLNISNTINVKQRTQTLTAILTHPSVPPWAKSSSSLLVDCWLAVQGELRVSGVTGRLEPEYPAWRRNLTRYLITLPVVLGCLLVVFVVMLLILQLQVGTDAWLMLLLQHNWGW